jgi:predicted transcriptional regulator
MAKMPRNRDRNEIIALILDATREPATRTKIMYDAMLNFHQVSDYLPVLIDSGMLKGVLGDKKYVATERGRRYIELYRQGEKLLSKALALQ